MEARRVGNLIDYFETDRMSLLEACGGFESVFLRMRYEGPISFRTNASMARRSTRHIDEIMERHIRKMEETRFFSFVRGRVPKLEPTVRFLVAEHDDLELCLKEIRGLLEMIRISGDRDPKLVSDVSLKGLGFSKLLQAHLWMEAEGLCRPADGCLRPTEKNELIHRLDRGHHAL